MVNGYHIGQHRPRRIFFDWTLADAIVDIESGCGEPTLKYGALGDFPGGPSD